MQAFTFQSLPSRVRFGAGMIASLPEEAALLGMRKALLISTSFQSNLARHVAQTHAGLIGALFDDAQMHTPTHVTERALEIVSQQQIDGLISIGGGSTTGLSKALALRTNLPQIAIPTTYAGSEATPILGETKDGLKSTIRDLRVLPETIIYDVDLTMTLPVPLSMTSGLNAMAHAVEALYACDTNPIISLIAEDAIRTLAAALPIIKQKPHHLEARSQALYGAWACGTCLGAVGMSIHHKLCHTLGGSFNLPHAETHAVLLAHSVAYNQNAAPEAMRRISRALGTTYAAPGLYALAKTIGAPLTLQSIGMHEDDLERAADLATANPYWNPRLIERGPILTLLQNAFCGSQPKPD